MRPYKFSKPLVESTNPPKSKDVLWVDVDEKDNDILTIKESRSGEWVNIIKDNGGGSGDLQNILSYLPGEFTPDGSIYPVQDVDPHSTSTYHLYVHGLFQFDDWFVADMKQRYQDNLLNEFLNIVLAGAVPGLGEYLKGKFISEIESHDIPGTRKEDLLNLANQYCVDKIIIKGIANYQPTPGTDDATLESYYMSMLLSDELFPAAKLSFRDTKHLAVMLQAFSLPPDDPMQMFYFGYIISAYNSVSAFVCVDQAQEHLYLGIYSIVD